MNFLSFLLGFFNDCKSSYSMIAPTHVPQPCPRTAPAHAPQPCLCTAPAHAPQPCPCTASAHAAIAATTTDFSNTKNGNTKKIHPLRLFSGWREPPLLQQIMIKLLNYIKISFIQDYSQFSSSNGSEIKLKKKYRSNNLEKNIWFRRYNRSISKLSRR